MKRIEQREEGLFEYRNIEPVHDRSPHLAPLNEVCAPQDVEVTGHGRFRKLEVPGEITCGHITLAQQLQDSPSGWIRKGAIDLVFHFGHYLTVTLPGAKSATKISFDRIRQSWQVDQLRRPSLLNGLDANPRVHDRRAFPGGKRLDRIEVHLQDLRNGF